MQHWFHLVFPGADWYVAPDWQHTLFDSQGLRWSYWERQSCIAIIKNAPHRVIFRIALPHQADASLPEEPEPYGRQQQVVYIKCYPLVGIRGLLERWHLSFKTRAECEKLFLLKEQGIPSLEPLAFGRDLQRAYLITREEVGTTPLDVWLRTKFPNLSWVEQMRVRLHLPRLLGQVIAQLHRAGLYHSDLHAGNFLVRYEQRQGLQLFLIDTHAIIRYARPLSWRQARRNLVMFGRWFLDRCQAVDRRRFLRYYLEFRPDWRISRPQAQRWALDLEQRTWRSLKRFYLRRDNLSWQNNRYFRTWHSQGSTNVATKNYWYGWASRDLPDEALLHVIGHFGTLLNQHSTHQHPNYANTLARASPTILDSTPTKATIISSLAKASLPASKVWPWHGRGRRGGFWEMTVETRGGPTRVFIKAFRLSTWRQRWAERLQLGPASRTWHNAYRLMQRDFCTPAPLALLHGRTGILPCWAILICEKYEDALNLRQALSYLQETYPSAWFVKVWDWIYALARLIARLHRHGFSHRDLKAAHFLIRRSDLRQPPQESALCLVDLVGISLPWTLTRRRRIQNLARLQVSFAHNPAISNTDRLRFLLTYLRTSGFDKQSWKWWWRRIALASQCKIARNLLRGRPLS